MARALPVVPQTSHSALLLERSHESASGQIALLPYLVILGQLGLLLLLFRQFQIETAAFRVIAVLAFAGFAVHAWLPLAWRLSFFSILSALGIGITLGLTTTLWLFGIGAVLIALCHLPYSWRARALLLTAALAVLVSMRAGWLPAPWSSALWPVLGGIFMFRLIIYFYDSIHQQAPASKLGTFAYFFMLPNVCFPLFPVIDYKAFRRNYFDADAFEIYQTGVRWILRGAVHLILYRLVYYYATLAPAEVVDASTLFQYLLANFLLYLRISGLFHLIVGMLYLFGFRLPETHHRYLLASSFTDFWRRINIYWKDFMLKLFYYPTVFRLKKFGALRAMVIATLIVFLMTWVLHAYQWFWLRGTYLLVWQDVLFWAILGTLVVVNSLREARYGRKRSIASRPDAWKVRVVKTAKIFVVFWSIMVLWSFWTAESIEQWLGLWPALLEGWTWTAALFPLGVLAVIVVGTFELPRPKRPAEASRPPRLRAVLAEAWMPTAMVFCLVLLGVESVHVTIGPQVANVVHSLRSGRLSRLDVAELERGYYENLLSVDRFNSQLWEVYSKRPPDFFGVAGANLKRFTDDFARQDLMPGRIAKTAYGPISVNKWGMRDQEYELVPPPNTMRMALLGPSTVMGWGVGDGETFESLLEARLNQRTSDSRFEKVEILNFGVPGYQPPQQLVALEKALRFSPNVVIYVAAGRELSRAATYLAEAVRDDIAIPYPPLEDVLIRAEVDAETEETEALRRLAPFEREILAWIYEHIVERTRVVGAEPLLVFLPQVRSGLWQEETEGTLETARRAGFLVIDLADVFSGYDVAQIRVADWDDHPNKLGHELIADRLDSAFETHRDRIFRSSSD